MIILNIKKSVFLNKELILIDSYWQFIIISSLYYKKWVFSIQVEKLLSPVRTYQKIPGPGYHTQQLNLLRRGLKNTT